MPRLFFLITMMFVLALGAAASAQTTAQDYLDTTRPLLFDGTLSGIRQAHEVLEQAVNDMDCTDCAGNRELLFFHTISRIAMIAIRNDGAPVDSAMELAEAFGVLFTGDLIRDITVTAPDWPENRYGQPEIPADAETLNSLAAFLNTSAVPEIEGIIDELNQISDSPEDRFRLFLTPDETAVFLDPTDPPYAQDIEVDYGEVLLLKGALSVIKGIITAKSAYDTQVNAQDRILEKLYEDCFSIKNDLLLPHPDFLKLLPTTNDPNDGAAVMAQSRQDILTGLQYYADTVDYLWNEDVPEGADPQGDELLSLDPADRYISDAIREKLDAIIASLQNDTPVTLDGKISQRYDLENSEEMETMSLWLEVSPSGKYETGEIEVSTGSFYNWYREVDFEIIGNQINGYADEYGYYGYFTGTLNDDRSMMTNASFEYWGYEEGSISDLSGSMNWENLEEQFTVDLNPVFGDSPRYPDPVSPRDLFPAFSDWNKPLPGTLPDATLGGILPEATQSDWTGWIDPQPDTKIPDWPVINTWQKVNGFVDVWLQNQLIFTDPTGDLGDAWTPEGIDIKELYMGYDNDYLHGCIVLKNPLEDYYGYGYDVSLSYCPNTANAPDTLKINISGYNTGLSGQLLLFHFINDYGYGYWETAAYFEVRMEDHFITFRIPFEDIPTNISGRYLSVDSSWGYDSYWLEPADENNTQIQVGTTASISGTVTFPGHRGGPIFVQVYADRNDPEESMVAYTMLNEPGNFTFDHIGLGFDGYIRAFSPLFGEYHIADMDAMKVEDIQSVTVNTQTISGIELNLHVPPVLEKDVCLSDSLNTTTNTTDYFAFDAVAGGIYTLDIFRANADYAQLFLLDRNGNDELIMLYEWQSRIDWFCPTSGRYYVKVADPEWYQYGGSYQLCLSSNIDLPTADISGPQWSGVKDGQVNLHDIALLAGYWLSDCSVPYWCDESDYDQSGTVDLGDLSTLLDEWLDTEN